MVGVTRNFGGEQVPLQKRNKAGLQGKLLGLRTQARRGWIMRQQEEGGTQQPPEWKTVVLIKSSA